MTTVPIDDLLDRQALHSNQLAAVMPDCIAIRDETRSAYTVVDLSRMSKVKRVYTTRPGLLVVAAGLLLIAAAAYSSRDGNSAALPFSLLGGAFLIGYFLTRRASVVFISDLGTIETMQGTFEEADEVFSAVGMVRFDHREPAGVTDHPLREAA